MEALEPVGIIIAVRPQTLNEFKDIIAPKLLSRIQLLPLPDMKEGNIDIKNISIIGLGCVVEKMNLQLAEDAVVISTTGLMITLDLTIIINLLLGIRIEAPTKATATNVELHITIGTAYQDKAAKIKVEDIKVYVSNLTVKIDGPLGPFAALITNLVIPTLKKEINQKVADLLKGVIEAELTGLASHIRFNSEVPGTPFGAEYHLTQNPIIDFDFLSFSFGGSFYNTAIPEFRSEVQNPVGLPIFDQTTNEKVQFFVSEHVIDSLLQALYTSGELNTALDGTKIPPGMPYSLNTTSLNSLFNGLEDEFGSEKAVILRIMACNNPPSVKIKAKSIEAVINGECVFDVETEYGWETALVISSSLKLEGGAKLTNDNLAMEISSIKFTAFKVEKSRLKDIEDEEFLISVINTILALARPVLNQKVFATGFPLPNIPYTNLNGATTEMHEGYLKIGFTAKLSQDLAKLFDRF
jgi:hypothetical protein